MKVKEPGVVAFIGLTKKPAHAVIGVLAIEQRLEPPIDLDAAIFANAQEDDAINDALDREVQIALRQFRVRIARLRARSARHCSIS